MGILCLKFSVDFWPKQRFWLRGRKLQNYFGKSLRHLENNDNLAAAHFNSVFRNL